MFDAAPDKWEPVALADCLEDFRNGWTYDTRAVGGTLPITRIETISNGEINYERVGFAQADERIEAFRLHRNDILFSHINSVEHIAKVAMKRDDAALYHGMNLMRLRPNHRVDPEFLFARLQSSETREHFRASCKRAVNQASLNKGEIGSYTFSLPPLDEQRRIAEVLRSVDAAIAAARAVVEAAQRCSQTMRHELLRVSLDGEVADVPAGWDVRPLEDLATVERGKFSIRPRNDPRYFGGSIPFIQTGDITSAGDYLTSHSQTLNELGVAVSRVFPAGTIMTTIAANIGDFTISTYPVACPDSVVGIEARDGIQPFWLYSVLSCFKVALDRASTQNAQKNINLQTLRPLLIPVPPPGMMTELAETLHAAADAAREAAVGFNSLSAFKRSIMDDLLSGRVRVPA